MFSYSLFSVFEVISSGLSEETTQDELLKYKS